MVVVAPHANHGIVPAVTVDNNPAVSRHGRKEAHEVEITPIMQIHVRFEDDNDPIGRFDIGRTTQVGSGPFWSIEYHFMSQRPRYEHVIIDILGAALMVKRIANKH
jgi:hypothetical protein